MAADFPPLVQILGDHPQPPPGVLIPPTLVTRAMAVRILKRPKGTIYGQTRKGGPLEAELWHGTWLIPMWRVMLEKAKDEEAHR